MHVSPGHLVVIECINEGDKSSRLCQGVSGQLRNVLDEKGLKFVAQLKVVSCTRWLQGRGERIVIVDPQVLVIETDSSTEFVKGEAGQRSSSFRNHKLSAQKLQHTGS